MVTILLPAINPGGWKEDQKINEKKRKKKKRMKTRYEGKNEKINK